jgi:hypothetical protein
MPDKPTQDNPAAAGKIVEALSRAIEAENQRKTALTQLDTARKELEKAAEDKEPGAEQKLQSANVRLKDAQAEVDTAREELDKAAEDKKPDAEQRLQSANVRLKDVQAEADAAQKELDEAAAKNKLEADKKIQGANERLAEANKELAEANKALEVLLPGKTESTEKWYSPAKKLLGRFRTWVASAWRYIVGALLVALLFLVVFFLLAGISGTPVSSAAAIWIYLSSLIIVAALLTAIFLLCRMTPGKEASSLPIGVLAALPAERVRDAAKHVEDADATVAKAESTVKAAETEFAGAKDADKSAAEEKLAKANDHLDLARKRLQFERQQFEFMLHGQAQLIAPGTLQYAVFGTLALIVLIFLMYGLVNQVLLPSLASISISRGLITFLIAVVTVSIALILVLATVVSESADRSQRFVQGKEILTMLIGVLGTIVGFYFGNVTDGAKSLQIAPPVVSSENPNVGDAIELTSFVSGGKAPFGIEATFLPANVIDRKEIQSGDGSIRFTGLRINKVAQDTAVSYQIKARDSEGRTGLYDSDAGGKHLYVKAK